MDEPQTQIIKVELIYALPEEQELITINVPRGTHIEDAIKRSGILKKYPQINLAETKVGIFSKISKLDTVLREGDRIEIYRELIVDPKEIRKKKAEAQKKK